MVAELHRAHRYDLIILDLDLPGMSGFDVMEALKPLETGACLPVLLVTADPDKMVAALAAGARDFVGKPLRLGLGTPGELERHAARSAAGAFDAEVADAELLHADLRGVVPVEISWKVQQRGAHPDRGGARH